ncbi:MAG: formate--tetrahydrofolate ligase [Candidatus Cloacimonetes bacterium]|nr:formate--tetrahydrofolate ligase [Candidatus Cloacimonadota bacterium]
MKDIQIAREANMLPIGRVANNFGLRGDHLEYHGKFMAKIPDDLINDFKDKSYGKLILVTAINPTPAGEGKTTTSIGLAQALNKLGKKAVVALREPSLGPCFGMKGGAAGGGFSQVVPMEDINLHFTGDFHAITTANNLLAALVDNHIQQGNALGIDPRRVTWKRCVDLNDRSLRHIVIGLGNKSDGTPRQDGFMITVASEVMAILCLADDLPDLKKRLGEIIVGYNYSGGKVTARDIKAHGSMAVLLKHAIKPNFVQTLENTPALIHGGPFANIAHGCNSIRATKIALKVGDYCVTEAGFGADLGAEKFINIKCRKAGLFPDTIVIVATIKALKYNGGIEKSELSIENSDAVLKGIVNLTKHIENMQKFGVPIVVSLNHFNTDTAAEINIVKEECVKLGASFALSKVWSDGGEGGLELAKLVIQSAESNKKRFKFLYTDDIPLLEKIEIIAKEIYGAGSVTLIPSVKSDLNKFTKMGYGHLPICMAKTQYSLSDNPNMLGRPENFEICVREVRLNAGAGFVVAITGDIMTMPGLPKIPSAEIIDIDENGDISGLF